MLAINVLDTHFRRMGSIATSIPMKNGIQSPPE